MTQAIEDIRFYYKSLNYENRFYTNEKVCLQIIIEKF